MFILAQGTNWSESDDEEEEEEEEEEVSNTDHPQDDQPADDQPTAVDQSESESESLTESEDEGPRLEFVPPTPRNDPAGRLSGPPSSHPMRAYPKTLCKDYPQRPCRVCKKKQGGRGRRTDTR